MTEPVTTLDTRFSDPGAVPTGWRDTRNVLETAQLFLISTVRGDGRRHVTPLAPSGSTTSSISLPVRTSRRP
jgi:hypothetical protein